MEKGHFCVTLMWKNKNDTKRNKFSVRSLGEISRSTQLLMTFNKHSRILLNLEACARFFLFFLPVHYHHKNARKDWWKREQVRFKSKTKLSCLFVITQGRYIFHLVDGLQHSWSFLLDVAKYLASYGTLFTLYLGIKICELLHPIKQKSNDLYIMLKAWCWWYDLS